MFYITDEAFIKLQYTYCNEHGGDFSSIDEAKASCLDDDNCQAVYDLYCEGSSFELCTMDTYYAFDPNTCVYQKYQGNSVPLIYITLIKMLRVHFYFPKF